MRRQVRSVIAEHVATMAPQLAALSDPWEVERQQTAALRQRLNEASQGSSDDFVFLLAEC